MIAALRHGRWAGFLVEASLTVPILLLHASTVPAAGLLGLLALLACLSLPPVLRPLDAETHRRHNHNHHHHRRHNHSSGSITTNTATTTNTTSSSNTKNKRQSSTSSGHGLLTGFLGVPAALAATGHVHPVEFESLCCAGVVIVLVVWISFSSTKVGNLSLYDESLRREAVRRRPFFYSLPPLTVADFDFVAIIISKALAALAIAALVLSFLCPTPTHPSSSSSQVSPPPPPPLPPLISYPTAAATASWANVALFTLLWRCCPSSISVGEAALLAAASTALLMRLETDITTVVAEGQRDGGSGRRSGCGALLLDPAEAAGVFVRGTLVGLGALVALVTVTARTITTTTSCKKAIRDIVVVFVGTMGGLAGVLPFLTYLLGCHPFTWLAILLLEKPVSHLLLVGGWAVSLVSSVTAMALFLPRIQPGVLKSVVGRLTARKLHHVLVLAIFIPVCCCFICLNLSCFFF